MQRLVFLVENIPLVLSLCKELKKAVRSHDTSAFYHSAFIARLFAVQPIATLDGLLGDPDQRQVGILILENVSDERDNPLDSIPVTHSRVVRQRSYCSLSLCCETRNDFEKRESKRAAKMDRDCTATARKSAR